MIPLADLKKQYQEIKPEIDEAIQEVIENGAFIQGKYCREFEENFAKACNKEFAIGCSNGTTALELALRAYNIGPGDEVIVPSHTFIATAEVVSILGAKPVFAEVEKITYCLDPSDIERRITPQTKAIIVVHLYGHTADMDAIFAIAQRHNLKVIEDCAQAHLAQYKGQPVPIGEIGCFSFFPGKNLGAYGDAGAVVTSNPELAQKIRAFLNHGRGPGEKYQHSSIGNNYRIDGIQGAILNVKLKHLEQWTTNRRNIADFYRNSLSEINNIVLPTEASYATHVYHLFVLRTPNRDKILAQLQEKGIGAGVHYPTPLHLQPAFAHLGYKKGDLPLTERLAEEILSLPVCGSITKDSAKTVCSVLKNAIREHRGLQTENIPAHTLQSQG